MLPFDAAFPSPSVGSCLHAYYRPAVFEMFISLPAPGGAVWGRVGSGGGGEGRPRRTGQPSVATHTWWARALHRAGLAVTVSSSSSPLPPPRPLAVDATRSRRGCGRHTAVKERLDRRRRRWARRVRPRQGIIRRKPPAVKESETAKQKILRFEPCSRHDGGPASERSSLGLVAEAARP